MTSRTRQMSVSRKHGASNVVMTTNCLTALSPGKPQIVPTTTETMLTTTKAAKHSSSRYLWMDPLGGVPGDWQTSSLLTDYYNYSYQTTTTTRSDIRNHCVRERKREPLSEWEIRLMKKLPRRPPPPPTEKNSSSDIRHNLCFSCRITIANGVRKYKA